MNNYELLLSQAAKAGVEVYSAPMTDHDGLYMDNVILLNSDLKTNAERACILAEELAHHFTACGNIISNSTLALQQELKGRRAAHEILAPIGKLAEAMTLGCCRTKYEVAEYLEITEEFLDEALYQYYLKYGPYISYGDSLLYFSPFGLLRKES